MDMNAKKSFYAQCARETTTRPIICFLRAGNQEGIGHWGQNKFEDSVKISLKDFKGSPIVNVSVPGNIRGRARVRVRARVARSGLFTITC